MRAGACGFTPQYAELQSLYNKYSSKGLVVLGFPCNQVGGARRGTPPHPPLSHEAVPDTVVWLLCAVLMLPHTVWRPGARLQL